MDEFNRSKKRRHDPPQIHVIFLGGRIEKKTANDVFSGCDDKPVAAENRARQLLLDDTKYFARSAHASNLDPAQNEAQ